MLAIRLGLRVAMSAAALIYAAGCAASALAPYISTMLLGRLLQPDLSVVPIVAQAEVRRAGHACLHAHAIG